MSVLQARVMESLDGLSDDNLMFLLNMIDKFMKPDGMIYDAKNTSTGGIQIGKFKGDKYIADGYDFDQDNEEIARLFGAGE